MFAGQPAPPPPPRTRSSGATSFAAAPAGRPCGNAGDVNGDTAILYLRAACGAMGGRDGVALSGVQTGLAGGKIDTSTLKFS